MNENQYLAYISLLKKELVPAMGCTEPIAIAYVAAKARSVLGKTVEKMNIYASGNIIKNVKSVTVPNTGGKKGIKCAAAIGVVSGDEENELQVISNVNADDISKMNKFLKEVPIYVHKANCTCSLEVTIIVEGEGHTALVCIRNEHSNIVKIEKDGKCILDKETQENEKQLLDTIELTMKDLYDFSMECNINDVKELLDCQIEYNYRIAEEGLKEQYGVSFGATLLSLDKNNTQLKAKAYAAAGSDARMSGCELPVIINSGSGNQGMAASLPVIIYAKDLNASKEQLYRALLISNLTTLYQKKFIGRLSAYCGVVSAGAGAGAGITYLLGGDYNHICHTVVNALAITSGIICDGAKPSCAAKIATCVDAGIMGHMMYEKGNQFYKGEGIVQDNIDNTIQWLGDLARNGMKVTDDEIIDMMVRT